MFKFIKESLEQDSIRIEKMFHLEDVESNQNVEFNLEDIMGGIKMLKRIEVIRRIMELEKQIKDKKSEIQSELKKMREACTTAETVAIIKESKEYIRLETRLETLHELLNDIQDMRYEEMFESKE